MGGNYNPITIRTSESVKEVELRSSEVILPLNTTAGSVTRQITPPVQIKPRSAAPAPVKKDDEQE